MKATPLQEAVLKKAYKEMLIEFNIAANTYIGYVLEEMELSKFDSTGWTFDEIKTFGKEAFLSQTKVFYDNKHYPEQFLSEIKKILEDDEDDEENDGDQ